jgi:putative SOS response-associated peptidase YedK
MRSPAMHRASGFSGHASSHSAEPREPQTGAFEQASLEWGLIPNFERSWPSMRPIHARAETIREKLIFSESYRLRRCVVPMTSYFQKDAYGKRHTIARKEICGHKSP